MREFDHHVEHFVDHFRVECGGGLVEQHDLGAHGERAGDGHTLLLAAGELGGILLAWESTPTRASRSMASCSASFLSM